MTTPPYVELNLSEIVHVCSSLADISASSIGPSNQKTLLTSSTGSVSFVNDGIDILGSLQFSNPVARLVVASLQNMHNHCADGSKRWILYVTEVLRSIEKHLKFQGRSNFGTTEKKFLRELSHALKDFEKEFFPDKILGMFLPFCHIETSDLDRTLKHLEEVIKTILMSSHNDSDSDFLATLVISFLQQNTSDPNSLIEVIESAIDHFDLFVSEGIGKHISSSQTISGILIPLQQQIPKVEIDPEKNLSFVFLLNFLEIDPKENCHQTTYRISKNSDSSTLYSFKNSSCKQFINDCISSGVKLILCCQEIPRFAETLFEQHQILAVPYVSEETCEYFRCIFKKHPLNNISDRITNANICVASFCKKAFVEDSIYLQLGIGQQEGVCISSTVLLSAPTPALYHNLKRRILKCLKSSRMCFESSSWSISGENTANCNVSTYNRKTTTEVEKRASSPCQGLPVLQKADVEISTESQVPLEQLSIKEQEIPEDQITSKGSNNNDEEIPRTENLFNRKIVTIPVIIFQSTLCNFLEDVKFKEFSDSNSNAQLLGEILASAFRQVYLKCSGETKRTFIESLQNKTFQGSSSDPQGDPSPKRFQLPLQTEFHILQSALHLVQQLLRIEGIIQVKGNENFNDF